MNARITNYLRAHAAEPTSEPVHYFLLRGYAECHDGDEWLGIYDSLPQLKNAYLEAVKELKREHMQNGINSWIAGHEKVMINTYNEATGLWHYDIPYEALFPEKKDCPCNEYKVVKVALDHADMFMFQREMIKRGRYRDYVCDGTPVRRIIDETISVQFHIKHTFEIFKMMGEWWGGWNNTPDYKEMGDKAQEWQEKYGAELVEVSHDTVIFQCRSLSEEEADALWKDICQIAPNSQDIREMAKRKYWSKVNLYYGGIEGLAGAVLKMAGGKMSKLKRSYLAICKEISINARVGGNVDGFYEDIGKRGELKVWESENLHPGERYISFRPEDGKSDLQTSCGRIEIKNDVLTIRTQENKNVYSFLLLKPVRHIEFKMRLPHRFLHVCDGCGKREILSSREAFEQGWDYPGPDGIYKNDPNYGFGILAPRTCGQCTINTSLYWKLTVDKEASNSMNSQEIAEALERIRNEPMSLIVGGDEINELQL